MSKEAEIEFQAVLREISPGQIIPHLLIGEREQAAPSYGYIIPPELLKDGNRVVLRRLVKGTRKGVEWEVELA